MRTVYRDYTRACANRRKKTIIYSICTSTLTLLIGLNLIQVLLVCALTWMTVWGFESLHVRRLQRIHLLGERK